ncbi:hypothetical protein ABZY81_38745 [Streptomyces sp. NPDC006514]|uniref:hypothetical protein n=1 Tax=Streptomyces sp. NPDC006514 TaxID=3154308 RepID=UPI0033B9E908
MRTRTAVLRVVAVPALVAAATSVLKSGRWQLYADRLRIELTPRPRRSCPDCRGEGGWWVDGAHPEMEACGCWANRPTWRIRLLPVPAWPDEHPF